VSSRVDQVDRAQVAGVELAFTVSGEGEPVVLIHAGVCADFFAPLLREPALVGGHRVLSYHRAGYGRSGAAPEPLTIADQAAHCHALMCAVGIARAHIVGHSSSAMMALQLVLDHPDAVVTLALLDPARPAVPTAVHEQFAKTVAIPTLDRYRSGDKAGAVDMWMRGVCGADYREALERAIPGAYTQALEDADTFFGAELPAVQQWNFTAEDARRISHPALVVVGENSIPTFAERRDLLMELLPNAESFKLPGATHLLQVENPRGMAVALAAFFARHETLREEVRRRPDSPERPFPLTARAC
jgi:pimeloyl-ACP methyl ester carboxylesterase